MSIAANLERIRQTLDSSVNLLAVTKQRSMEEIQECIDAGISLLGENRVQEAETKFPLLPPETEKHLIGHLQTNKVKRALQLFDLIQSVDSDRLAEAIDREAEQLGRVFPVFLQVNIAQDPQKYGFSPEDFLPVVERIGRDLPHVQVKGLMTIVPFLNNPEDARPHFRAMRSLFEKIQKASFPRLELTELSMGMSHDYLVAVEEGSTMVRIGSAIFE